MQSLLFLFIFGTYFANSLLITNECYEEGKTWSNEGDLEVIVNVMSVGDCLQNCLENEDCQGYTWYDHDGKISNVCTLFANLIGEYECQHCLSGKRSDSDKCSCGEENGECAITSNNFMFGAHATSSLECFALCQSTEGCKFYTFYDSTNENTHNLCMLFTTCDDIIPCKSGCHVGRYNAGWHHGFWSNHFFPQENRNVAEMMVKLAKTLFIISLKMSHEWFKISKEPFVIDKGMRIKAPIGKVPDGTDFKVWTEWTIWCLKILRPLDLAVPTLQDGCQNHIQLNKSRR